MFSLLPLVILVLPAAAQSLLTFPHVVQTSTLRTGFSITNTSDFPAEVDFTLYSLDGRVLTGLANPVRYRIESRGQLSMLADEVFAASQFEGWVEVASPTSGIEGYLFEGDFGSTLDATRGASAFTDQIVPWLGNSGGELRIINSSSDTALVNVRFTNSRGDIVGSVPAHLNANSGIRLSTSNFVFQGGGNLTARVTSDISVVAQALVETNGSLVLVNGQSVSTGATFRSAPHVILGNGFDSTLILANPTGQAVTVSVMFFNENGGPAHRSLIGPLEQHLTIPANGSVSVGAVPLTGLLIAPAVNGWIEVTSPNIPLGALLVIAQSVNRTAYPLQTESLNRVFYPRLSEGQELLTGLVLVNPRPVSTSVAVKLVDSEGFIISSSRIELAANSKQTSYVSQILPGFDLRESGLLMLESSGVYGLEIIGNEAGGLLAAVEPQFLVPDFEPKPSRVRPELVNVSPLEGRSGDSIRIRTMNAGDESTVFIGDQPLTARFLAPGIAIQVVDIPVMEPGFAELRVRSVDGLESDPVSILVLPNDATSFREVHGRAFYEKVDVGSEGLNLARPVMVPIRYARVEILNYQTGLLVSIAETNEKGSFRAAVPEGQDYTLRVLSQLRSSEVLVADNTNGGSVFSVGVNVDNKQIPVLFARDSTRTSGAFNILEVVRQGNAYVGAVDPGLELPHLTIFWSPNNKNQNGNPFSGEIGGTFFNVSDSTAFILGDRTTDSDEFDDAVILHEYAHLLAARFSTDDSPGGAHVLGDVLDPRVAWSEGWANFFSAAVRNDPVYRDSVGLEGSTVLKYDLEINSLTGDQPGYWSEFSVHSILWDLFDGADDTGDFFQVPFTTIWSAFRSLVLDNFVYLPTFLDRLAVLAPEATSSLEQVVRLRAIDFSSANDPSVSYPFPRILTVNLPVIGEVDSLSRARQNLAQSSHLYSFEADGGPTSIRLDVTGHGPGQNPDLNDLDLLLMDSAGSLIDRSDRGLNGQSELISTFLPAGRYVVEIRSFYTRGETGKLVFNSGAYRLIVRAH